MAQRAKLLAQLALVGQVGTGGPVGPVGTVDTVGCSIASTELCELVQEHNLIFMHKKFNLIRPALHVSGEKIHIFAIFLIKIL